MPKIIIRLFNKNNNSHLLYNYAWNKLWPHLTFFYQLPDVLRPYGIYNSLVVICDNSSDCPKISQFRSLVWSPGTTLDHHQTLEALFCARKSPSCGLQTFTKLFWTSPRRVAHEWKDRTRGDNPFQSSSIEIVTLSRWTPNQKPNPNPINTRE